MSDSTGVETPAFADNPTLEEAMEADKAPAPEVKAETVPAPVTEEAPVKAEPEKDRIQQRIDKLTAEKYESFRERDKALYEVENLKERLAKLEAKEAPTNQVAPDDFPTLEGSNYDEADYRQKLAAYLRTTAQKEAAAVLHKEREAVRQRELADTWDKRQEEFAKSKLDYREKVSNPSLPITAAMVQTLQESENGPEVAYYLAEHPDQARAIAGLSAMGQAREIGRIEAKLDAQKAQAKAAPVVSQAPPPPPKIEAAAASNPVRTTDASGDALSDEEWVRRERQRIAKKAR